MKRSSGIFLLLPILMILPLTFIDFGMKEPPKIEVRSGDISIEAFNRKIEWDGETIRTPDLFVINLKNKTRNDLEYLKIGQIIEISFEKDPPDTIDIYDYVLNDDGKQRFSDRTTQKNTIKMDSDKLTFQLEEKTAYFLSRASLEYQQGKIIRGFVLFCRWYGRQYDNTCEYAFIIRTDPNQF